MASTRTKEQELNILYNAMLVLLLRKFPHGWLHMDWAYILRQIMETGGNCNLWWLVLKVRHRHKMTLFTWVLLLKWDHLLYFAVTMLLCGMLLPHMNNCPMTTFKVLCECCTFAQSCVTACPCLQATTLLLYIFLLRHNRLFKSYNVFTVWNNRHLRYKM